MSTRRILWVGIPLALLMLPITLAAICAAIVCDAWMAGVMVYRDLSQWMQK